MEDTELIKQLEKTNKALLSALLSMTYQYLSSGREEEFTHDFMSTGEETLGLLEDMGYVVEYRPSRFQATDKLKNFSEWSD
jgi:hypothetical protein